MPRSPIKTRGQTDNIIGDVIIVLYISYVLRIKLPLRVADCARVLQQQKAWPELVRLPFIPASDYIFVSDYPSCRSFRYRSFVYAPPCVQSNSRDWLQFWGTIRRESGSTSGYIACRSDNVSFINVCGGVIRSHTQARATMYLKLWPQLSRRREAKRFLSKSRK